MRFLVTKIILEIFVFGSLLIHFLSLPKVDWCLTRWRQVSLYPVLLVPLYMLMLNLFRLYLTSIPTNYQNCVHILSMARMCPFAWKCIMISEIILLVLAIIPTLAGITHLFLCVKFIYDECYDNQFRLKNLPFSAALQNFPGFFFEPNFQTNPVEYLKVLRMLDFPSQLDDVQLLVILHKISVDDLDDLVTLDRDHLKVKTKSGDNLLHLAVKSHNHVALEWLLSDRMIDVNQGSGLALFNFK